MRPLEFLLVPVGTLVLLLLWRRGAREARALTLLALAFLPLVFWPQRPRLLTFSVLPLLWLGALLMWALPVAQLPKPDGSYPVGTLNYHLVDAAREEAYTETEGDARELMVRPTTHKLRHMAQNPSVALNFDGNGRGGDIIVFTGEATLLEESTPADQVAAYVEKYTPLFPQINSNPEEFARAYSAEVRVRPTRL